MIRFNTEVSTEAPERPDSAGVHLGGDLRG